MPIKKCAMPDGGTGFQWGDHGTCFADRADAVKQAKAAYGNGFTGDESLEQAITDAATVADKRTITLCDAYDADSLVLDATPHITKDGYLVAHAKVARTGIQIYRGDELGMPNMQTVRVYRPESAVFDPKSMRTYAHKPITLDHPTEPVTSENWKRLAGGDMGQEVVRDGRFISVPLVLMDKALIDTVQKKNVKGLSVGYNMGLTFEAGQTKSGEAYDAIMSDIDVNHLAIVPAGRGGPELRIEDKEPKMANKTFTVDKVTVTADEIHAQVIEKALGDRDGIITDLRAKLESTTADAAKAKATSEAAIADLTTKSSAKDGEIVVLKKAVEDGKVTPAMLAGLAKDRAILTAKSVKLLGDKYPFDTKTNDEIMRDAVAKHMGDKEAEAVKAMDAAAIGGAFRAITKDFTVSAADGVTQLATVLDAHGQTTVTGDTRDAAFKEGCTYLENAYIHAGAVPPGAKTN